MAEETINLWENPQDEEQTTTEVTTAEESAQTETQTAKEYKLDAQEQFFMERLNEMAQEDEYLARAMTKADKNVKELFAYMTFLAKKKAKNGAQCVAVEGSEMLGWAKHYYIESKETIDAEMKPKLPATPKTATPAKTEPKKDEPKKTYSNPLLQGIANSSQEQESGRDNLLYKPAETTTTDKKGNVITSTTNLHGERTTTITKNGQTYSMTELSLF